MYIYMYMVIERVHTIIYINQYIIISDMYLLVCGSIHFSHIYTVSHTKFSHTIRYTFTYVYL